MLSAMALSRRRFLQGTLAGGTLLPLVSLEAGCGNNVVAAPVVNALVGDDGKVRVDVQRYPDLVPIGGAITLRFDLPATSPYHVARSGVLLVHRAAAEDPPAFVATQSACPHAGCPLGYNPASSLIECPCHSSRFRSRVPDDLLGCIGEVIHAPANQDLVVFRTDYQVSTQQVVVDLNRTLPCGGGTPFPAAVNGELMLPFTDFSELQTPGGSSVGQPDGWPDTLIVVRVDATTVRALSAVCTHLNCNVAYDIARTRILCPCHGSAYTLDAGQVLNGPATDPLHVYSATLTATGVTITLA